VPDLFEFIDVEMCLSLLVYVIITISLFNFLPLSVVFVVMEESVDWKDFVDTTHRRVWYVG